MKKSALPLNPIVNTNCVQGLNCPTNGQTVQGNLEQRLQEVQNLMTQKQISDGMVPNNRYRFTVGTYGDILFDDYERITILGTDSYEIEEKKGLFGSWKNERTVTYTQSDKDAMIQKVFGVDAERRLVDVANLYSLCRWTISPSLRNQIPNFI